MSGEMMFKHLTVSDSPGLPRSGKSLENEFFPGQGKVRDFQF